MRIMKIKRVMAFTVLLAAAGLTGPGYLNGYASDYPSDEKIAFAQRTSDLPLSNAIHQACVLCHTNFTPEFFQKTNNPGQWVGALTLSVPIKNEH